MDANFEIMCLHNVFYKGVSTECAFAAMMHSDGPAMRCHIISNCSVEKSRKKKDINGKVIFVASIQALKMTLRS